MMIHLPTFNIHRKLQVKALQNTSFQSKKFSFQSTNTSFQSTKSHFCPQSPHFSQQTPLSVYSSSHPSLQSTILRVNAIFKNFWAWREGLRSALNTSKSSQKLPTKHKEDLKNLKRDLLAKFDEMQSIHSLTSYISDQVNSPSRALERFKTS